VGLVFGGMTPAVVEAEVERGGGERWWSRAAVHRSALVRLW
jgi:hypothetical protein